MCTTTSDRFASAAKTSVFAGAVSAMFDAAYPPVLVDTA